MNSFVAMSIVVKRAIIELEYERTHMSIEKRYLKAKWEEADEIVRSPKQT